MKQVLVTGGAGGIGSEIVQAMLERDFLVHVIDIDEEAGRRLSEKHGADRVIFHRVDVTDMAALTATAAALKSTLSLDHIITLAGRAIPEEWDGFAASPAEAIRKSIELNLVAHLQTVYAFLPLMKEEGDRSILLVSSINAITHFGLPVYSAAKAGLIGFVNASLGEFGKQGIRINALLPGTVVTEATQTEPKDFAELLKTTALNRFVPAREVGIYAATICCDLQGVTGQALVQDAGQTKMHMI